MHKHLNACWPPKYQSIKGVLIKNRFTVSVLWQTAPTLGFSPAKLQMRQSVWTDLPSFGGNRGLFTRLHAHHLLSDKSAAPLICCSPSFSPVPQNNLLTVNTSRGLKRQHKAVTLQSSGIAAAAAAALCQQAFSERLLTTSAFTCSFAGSNCAEKKHLFDRISFFLPGTEVSITQAGWEATGTWGSTMRCPSISWLVCGTKPIYFFPFVLSGQNDQQKWLGMCQ